MSSDANTNQPAGRSASSAPIFCSSFSAACSGALGTATEAPSGVEQRSNRSLLRGVDDLRRLRVGRRRSLTWRQVGKRRRRPR